MTKQDTLARRKGGETVDVLTIFAEHYKLASSTMTPAAALHTAYTAASNYLTAKAEAARVNGEEGA